MDDVLLEYTCVHHMYTCVCLVPGAVREGIGSPGTVIAIVISCHVGAGNQNLGSLKSGHAL